VISLDADERMLRDTVRDFFNADVASSRRAVLEPGFSYDGGQWKRASGELGLTGLAVAEALGGQGFGTPALAVVMEEAGRALLAGPLFATVALAANLLTALPPGPDRDALLQAVASGQRTATFAWRHDTNDPVVVTAGSSGPLLTGTVRFVVDGDSADFVLVTAHSGPDLQLFAVDALRASTRRRMDSLDLTRPQAVLTFRETPARLLASGDAAIDALRHGLDLARVALANESVGAARAALAQAVTYAGTRRQFGRPIGSFQAIKHRCADLLVELETAWSLARHAALIVDDPNASRGLRTLMPAMACAEATDTFARVAAENIHIHGGIGFTWEHSAHLYLRRAKANQSLLGRPSELRERVMQQLRQAGMGQ